MYCGGGSEGLPMPEFGLEDITRSCVEFRNGSWVTYEDVLNKSRWYHTSWKTYDGIIWIGGESFDRQLITYNQLNNKLLFSTNTSEKTSGTPPTSSKSFDLVEWTM